MNPYRKILIVRTDRIGDVVLTTPAIRSLRRQWPDAHIAVLVSPVTRELVEGNPDINEVLVDDRYSWHKGALSFWSLVLGLRRRNFDLAVVFHTKRRTNMLCFLAGIPHRLGYRNEKYGFLLTRPLEDRRPAGIKHEAEYCLDLIRSLGVTDGSLETFVPVQPAAEEWVIRTIKERGFPFGQKPVAVHPGASDSTKCWPAERFVELINRMAEQYHCSFVLIGASPTCPISEKIRSSVHVPLIDLTGATSVAQLAALLKHCRMLISNDSGPVHIADAVGTPVVSIFTRNQPGINPRRWQPLGSRSRAVAPPLQEGISFASGKIIDTSYLDEVTVEQVGEAVDAVYKLC